MEHSYATAGGHTSLTERRAGPDRQVGPAGQAALAKPLRGLAALGTPAAGLALADAALWSSLLGAPALSADELATLAALASQRHVAAGQSVLCRSTAASTLVALRSGEVALGFRTATVCCAPSASCAARPGWT